MSELAQQLSYRDTGAFSALAVDYSSGDSLLRPFYSFEVSTEAAKKAIEERQLFKVNRNLLVARLQAQFGNHQPTEKQAAHLQALLAENTFTICTAHQPNIFTGPLYFIYKILHAIKLADEWSKLFPENKFVPVYYMGSEDADLDELGNITLDGLRYNWQTNQTGAVGRMLVDDTLLKMMADFTPQLLSLPYGQEIITLVQQAYQKGTSIAVATAYFVNQLFGRFGLLVLQPDDADLKASFIPVLKKELATQFSAPAVAQTIEQFPEKYKVQAGGRALNLFYLTDQQRRRIEKSPNGFVVVDSDIQFTTAEMDAELQAHPERFSPNVILRPVFQESILPNIAFVGGGGELAYWLELKAVFAQAEVFYPMLILRNSFAITSSDHRQLMEKLQLGIRDIFKPANLLMADWVKKESALRVDLAEEKLQLEKLYQQIQQVAAAVDPTLGTHTNTLYFRALAKIETLEKKMLRAEKRKYTTQQRQIEKLKAALFPNNGLQERVENFMRVYAAFGSASLDHLYDASLTAEQLFTVVHW